MMMIAPNSLKDEKWREEVKRMMFAPNSHASKEEKQRGEVQREYVQISGEEEGGADYGGWVSSQQDVAPYEKGVIIFNQPTVLVCWS